MSIPKFEAVPTKFAMQSESVVSPQTHHWMISKWALVSLITVVAFTVLLTGCGVGAAAPNTNQPSNQAPVAALTVTPSSGTAPLPVTADSSASSDPDGTIASRSINFGDGTTVNNQASATHTYSASGTYTVTVTVTDDKGASNSASKTVTVNSATNKPPVASLSISPTTGTVPFAVTADTSASTDSDGTIASRSINFGDGTVVNNQASASHTYTTAGNYTVTATVTDNNGASNSTTKTVTANSVTNQPPVAVLSVTPTSGTVPLNVSASTTGSNDPDGTIASTSINWGDGTTTAAASGSHTYTSAGTYTVTATVTDNKGATGTATKTVTANAANVPPVAVLSVTPSSGAIPLIVSASTTGSNDPDGTIASTLINWGDGSTTAAASGTHTYAVVGSYTVTATVTDNKGATGTATKTVTATAVANVPPVAMLSVTPTSGSAPLIVSASTTGSNDPDGTIASTSINWGDGSTTNAASGTHTYNSVGSYTVTATVTDNGGASSSATKTVAVSSGSGGSSQWVTPIGHPTPTFGLLETAPANPSPWDATHTTNGGYQFYYVCPGCTGSTDSSNSFGYPGKGRSTIPDVTGPAVIVLGNAGGNVNANLDGSNYNGTAAAPIFLRSYDSSAPTTLTEPIGVSTGTHYLIVENLRFTPSSGSDTNWGFFIQEGADHVVFRNNEVVGNTTSNSTGFGLGSWSYSGSAWVDNVVVLNNHIHQQYDINASGDPDDHCITVNGSVRETYIWYNELDHCAGDGVQVEAQHDRGAAKIHNIYIGKNYSHHNRQSGFWVKHATDVIMSQNKADNVWGNAGNGDPGICYGGQYTPVRTWFLYNECSNANIALAVSSDDGDAGQSMYFVGNWVHDLNAKSTGVYDSGGIRCESQSSLFFVNNLFYGLNRNLNFLPGCGSVQFNGNITSRAAGDTSHYDIYTESGVSIKFNNNIFSSSPWFTSSGGSWSTCTGLANIGTTVGCSTTQPTFVNAAADDFHLSAGSAGVDVFTTTDSVYSTFQTLYGRSIQFDADGTARPKGAGWDLGPYER